MNAQITSKTWMEYDDVGHGMPVVLLHAFPLSRAMWRPQIQAWKNHYRLIVPDLRGFGDSSPFGSEPSLKQMTDDVAGLLKTLNIQAPVAMVGLSMGGYIALAFARQYPQLLKALVLADTRAEADDAKGKETRNELIEFMRQHSAQDLIERLLPKLVSEQTLREQLKVVEEIHRIAAQQTPSGISGALQVLRDRPDASVALSAIRVPTLVLVGSEDTTTPPVMAQTLAHHIPNAQLEQIPGAGHLSNLEQPTFFNRAVHSFLQSLPNEERAPFYQTQQPQRIVSPG